MVVVVVGWILLLVVSLSDVVIRKLKESGREEMRRERMSAE
jgi:hypothetical protein